MFILTPERTVNKRRYRSYGPHFPCWLCGNIFKPYWLDDVRYDDRWRDRFVFRIQPEIFLD